MFVGVDVFLVVVFRVTLTFNLMCLIYISLVCSLFHLYIFVIKKYKMDCVILYKLSIYISLSLKKTDCVIIYKL